MNSKRYQIKYNIKLTISTKDFIKKIQEIDSDKIKILHVNEEYDGPEEGVCLMNDEKYYFKVFDSFDDFKSREKKSYFLIKLNKDQLENEEFLHKDFLRSTNYDEYSNYVNRYPDQIIEESQIVGWFEM